jgi:tRNA threonylcarbamoyl adenosine modification protein YeaZ
MRQNKKKTKDFVIYLNTSKDKSLDVFLIKSKKITDQIVLSGGFKVSDKLLNTIDQLLKRHKLDLNQVAGIICIIGPGAFTSLRIAVTVANTLSFVLNIPVIGLINKNLQLSNEILIKTGLKKLRQVKPGQYLLPYYDREPNITLKKK